MGDVSVLQFGDLTVQRCSLLISGKLFISALSPSFGSHIASLFFRLYPVYVVESVVQISPGQSIGLELEIFPIENLPKHLPVLTGIRPGVGIRLSPDSLSQLVLSA